MKTKVNIPHGQVPYIREPTFICVGAPYHITKEGVINVENKYKAHYMGSWCIKNNIRNVNFWTDFPVDVFYQPNPDRSKGHSNYFGIFTKQYQNGVFICNAESAFSEKITGVLYEDKVHVSRYRHDFVRVNADSFIDGGRDYLRMQGNNFLVNVTAKENTFVMTIGGVEDFSYNSISHNLIPIFEENELR